MGGESAVRGTWKDTRTEEGARRSPVVAHGTCTSSAGRQGRVKLGTRKLQLYKQCPTVLTQRPAAQMGLVLNVK